MAGPVDLRGAENLRRWKGSGQPRLWVEARQGRWNHSDWLSLLETLRESEFWPMGPVAVALALDELKRQYWNLFRWKESGQPRLWVECCQGRWNHDDWLSLL